MRYLLDTNVVSELRKKDTANPNVTAWAAALPAQDMAISVVTLLEIERGALRAKRRDARQGLALGRWLDNLVKLQFEGRIIEVDVAIARLCATLHVPDPRPELDALIAATALVHDLTVVTRNTRDFEDTGVKLLNPWTTPHDLDHATR